MPCSYGGQVGTFGERYLLGVHLLYTAFCPESQLLFRETDAFSVSFLIDFEGKLCFISPVRRMDADWITWEHGA